MEHTLYVNDTDDYYDDGSDTLFMELSDICDKSDDSEEEKESLLEHCHYALSTYVCNINNGLNCLFFSLKHN